MISSEGGFFNSKFAFTRPKYWHPSRETVWWNEHDAQKSQRFTQSLEWTRFFQNVSLLHPAFHRSQCWLDGGSIPSHATRWCHEVHSQSFTSRKHIPFSGFSLRFRCRAKIFQPRVPSRDSELYYAELKKNCQRYSLKSGKTDITETYTPDSFLSKFLLNFKTVFKIMCLKYKKKIHH